MTDRSAGTTVRAGRSTSRQQAGWVVAASLSVAVAGMLPKTPLGRRMLSKLKVYTDSEHPHTAQKPEALDLSRI